MTGFSLTLHCKDHPVGVWHLPIVVTVPTDAIGLGATQDVASAVANEFRGHVADALEEHLIHMHVGLPLGGRVEEDA